ncbi:MAG: GNAT family N-acetyltransferase [Pseudomonadales bacterium]
MDITLRPARPEDAEVCGKINYDAFHKISTQHNFPPDWPTVEVATGFLTGLLAHPGFYGVVAEADGRIVGSNFLDERASVVGLGPITVDPQVQNAKIGRELMVHAMDRAWLQGRPSIRLVQAAFHGRSLSLYTKLGFDVREPLSCMQGEPVNIKIPGYTVRPATADDLQACDALCKAIHGYARHNELEDAVQAGTAMVVEHDGVITGQASMIGFGGYAVGRTNTDLKALIGAAPEFAGPGFLLPTRNSDLLRWCLEAGLKIIQPMTYMSVGLYNEPQGAYLPSILL